MKIIPHHIMACGDVSHHTTNVNGRRKTLSSAESKNGLTRKISSDIVEVRRSEESRVLRLHIVQVWCYIPRWLLPLVFFNHKERDVSQGGVAADH